MAEFNGSSTLSRSVAQLLETSEDPAAIAALLPGCEALHRTDAEHIEGRLATEVAGIPVTAAVSVRRTVEMLADGAARLHLRLKVRPDIGGHAVVAAIIDLAPVAGDAFVHDHRLLLLTADHLANHSRAGRSVRYRRGIP